MTTSIYKLTKTDRVEIVMDIVYKLRNFKDRTGNTIDHYKGNYSFIPQFKEICNNYIHQNDNEEIKEFSGFIHYPEVNRTVEYKLPNKKFQKSLFVFRSRET